MKAHWQMGLAWLARLILAGTFLAAGLVKLSDLAQAQLAVAGYRLLPDALLWPATLLLPWLETVGALALLWNRTLRAAQGLVGILLLVFLIAILSAWARGIDLTCGCFGGTGTSNYPWLVIRDLLLLGLVALAGIQARASPAKISPAPSTPASSP